MDLNTNPKIGTWYPIKTESGELDFGDAVKTTGRDVIYREDSGYMVHLPRHTFRLQWENGQPLAINLQYTVTKAEMSMLEDAADIFLRKVGHMIRRNS